MFCRLFTQAGTRSSDNDSLESKRIAGDGYFEDELRMDEVAKGPHVGNKVSTGSIETMDGVIGSQDLD